jgi:hypothetical protein
MSESSEYPVTADVYTLCRVLLAPNKGTVNINRNGKDDAQGAQI